MSYQQQVKENWLILNENHLIELNFVYTASKVTRLKLSHITIISHLHLTRNENHIE